MSEPTYVVRYRVVMQDAEFTAGPFPGDDVAYQAADIAGYEGVYDVRIESAREEGDL